MKVYLGQTPSVPDHSILNRLAITPQEGFDRSFELKILDMAAKTNFDSNLAQDHPVYFSQTQWMSRKHGLSTEHGCCCAQNKYGCQKKYNH